MIRAHPEKKKKIIPHSNLIAFILFPFVSVFMSTHQKKKALIKSTKKSLFRIYSVY